MNYLWSKNKMALIPKNQVHANQIRAGITGRKKGHKFEYLLAQEINKLSLQSFEITDNRHLYTGNPALILMSFVEKKFNLKIKSCTAYWLGGLATSGVGDVFFTKNGKEVKKSKSDVLLELKLKDGTSKIIGVSVKTCSKKTPTNDQIFFTTANAFCNLLEENSILVTEDARKGMEMFCGTIGFRPIDLLEKSQLNKRISDKNRFYWEEIPEKALRDWEYIFSHFQDEITRILFQKAYKDDPFYPEILLHQIVQYEDFNNCPIAIYTIDEIISISHYYSGYTYSTYRIKKGSNINDKNEHLAPRFGFIQFQRGGQKQHPTQLQFNLKSGYFKLSN